MIKELKKEEIDIIDNSFIDKDYLLNEFDNNPFIKVLLLIEDNKVIGYLYYSDIYDRAEINQIEIDSFYRNCGNGKKLMEYMINHVDKDITLEVKNDNDPAIKLYKKYGFKEVATRKGYYQGTDGILMERNVKHNK